MGKSAILLGATGLTGHNLLHLLLADDRYDRIIIFGRHSCGAQHPKLTEHIIDLFELSKYADAFVAHEVYCCIGTTKAKTPDTVLYEKIDYGIPVTAAKLCKANHIKTFIVISALSANPNSKLFYNRVKGKMEDAVLAEQIPNTYIMQPSLIIGTRADFRLGEYLVGLLMRGLNPIFKIGKLKRYQAIKPETIAKCMVWVANNGYGTTRIKSHIIQELGGKTH